MKHVQKGGGRATADSADGAPASNASDAASSAARPPPEHRRWCIDAARLASIPSPRHNAVGSGYLSGSAVPSRAAVDSAAHAPRLAMTTMPALRTARSRRCRALRSKNSTRHWSDGSWRARPGAARGDGARRGERVV
eukprot:361448-Chlamydomonas_euryale.AAC.5